jgi:hypothetical protein
MGNTIKARKATFNVEVIKGQRVFTAVNKRAHTVARKLGKRSKLTVAELKSSVGKGSYKFYQYTSEGTLKPIKF